MNPLVSDLTAKVSKATTVMKSATIAFNGVTEKIAAAIAAALANGATAEELQPLSDLNAEFTAETDALAAAVVANTGATAATA